MDTIVGLKELREDMATYVARIQRGQSFVVVRRSQPLFRVVPVDEVDGQWEAVVDFTKLRRGGIAIDEILKRL